MPQSSPFSLLCPLSTDANGTRCRCVHLTDFATYFLSTYAESLTTVSEVRHITPEALARSYGTANSTHHRPPILPLFAPIKADF
jgi:hypothetical protein